MGAILHTSGVIGGTGMKPDPIVEETRKLREQYAAQMSHDTNTLFDDIVKRQNQRGKNLVTFPRRKPYKKSTAV